jgi:catalase
VFPFALLFQVLILFSDRGTPDGYHHMHGYSGHTFKFVNKDGKFVYYQLHLRADKGFKTLSNAKAGELSGSNPDYGIQTLFEDIEKGEYPSWTVYVVSRPRSQTMPFARRMVHLLKHWILRSYVCSKQ